MRLKAPQKQFYQVPSIDGCSCNVCPYMRLNTKEKVLQCLKTLQPEININKENSPIAGADEGDASVFFRCDCAIS